MGEGELMDDDLEISYSMLSVPGEAPNQQLKGVDCQAGQIRQFDVTQYRGRFLVVVFYHADWDSADLLQAFCDLSEKFKSQKTEIVGCSTDPAESHAYWLRADRKEGGFGGGLSSRISALWSDPGGILATKYDLYSEEENECLDGVVIIDDKSNVRHVMTSSLSPSDLASNTLDLVKLLRNNKVEDVTKPTPSVRPMSPVKLTREQIEKDWDVSEDPELQKVLNRVKMLGRAPAPKPQKIARTPTFDLIPAVIRKLRNPRASIKWCSASLLRNLAGYSGALGRNQKLELENLVKKVMGVAYMPEDLTGKYTNIFALTQREQTKFLENDIFKMTGDSWKKEPGSVQWSDGQGVFVNNYSNFVLWVNEDDQLRLISVSKGQDLKYLLLRLQKAIARIEEALKMVLSSKSCQQRGFATKDGGFNHNKMGVFGTGLEITFTMELPGFQKAEKCELDKAKMELAAKIDLIKPGSALFSVVLTQFPEDSERDIVTKSVEMVDKLAKMDQELQSRLGIKLTL